MYLFWYVVVKVCYFTPSPSMRPPSLEVLPLHDLAPVSVRAAPASLGRGSSRSTGGEEADIEKKLV